jgi:hypothetical protein
MLVALPSDLNRAPLPPTNSRLLPTSHLTHREHDRSLPPPPSLFPRVRGLAPPAISPILRHSILLREPGHQQGRRADHYLLLSTPSTCRHPPLPPPRHPLSLSSPIRRTVPTRYHSRISLQYPRAHHGRARRGSLEQFEQRLCECATGLMRPDTRQLTRMQVRKLYKYDRANASKRHAASH